jgi:glycosyltransferase involved in cell wall biosynthesis
MRPDLCVAIPAHNEEAFLGDCIRSIHRSAAAAAVEVEVVVALNRCTDRTREVAEALGARCVVEDRKCIAAVRNAAVRATSGPFVVTLDADSRMLPGTVAALLQRRDDPGFIGGGSFIRPERLSVGIFFSVVSILPYVLGRGVSAGMFWFQREAFDSVGGFDERLVSVEDIDFGKRLKQLGRQRGLRYGTIWRAGIVTSCRKFDRYGDWYLFRHPRLVRALFSGTDRAAADAFYYDAER